MLQNYHLLGSLSASFTLLSLIGLVFQINEIYKRKRESLSHNKSYTNVISINRFFTSFLSFYSMMLYGICLPEINLYIVVPRVIATLLLVVILFEVDKDRKTSTSRNVFFTTISLLIISVLVLFSDYRIANNSKIISSSLVIITTILYLQGAVSQIRSIEDNKSTGSLSLAMHVLFFFKDFFSLLFGVIIGADIGWPLMIFHSASCFMQMLTLRYFYIYKESKKLLIMTNKN